MKTISRYIITLALLLTAVTGAWATDYTTLAVGDVIKVGDTFTPTAEGAINDNGVNDGVTYTLIRADVDNGVTEKTDGACYVFKFVSEMYSYIHFEGGFEVTAISDGLVVTEIETVKGKQSYTLTVHEPAEAPITVEPGSSANTWTFTQPGGDVVLTPLYAPTAAWAEVETVKQLPAAAEGVIAGTDAPLIAEGTGIVAFAGTSTEVTQGTVMYAVTPATATTAPDLDAADTWSADVPTAEDVADDGAEVKVWYYILGADAPDGVAATLDNTFNNSEVSSLTVTVLSNKFDLTLKAANANTIDATEASKGTVSVKVGDAAAVDKTKDITDGKLKAIKMGSEVKLNTKAGYKFRKVEVKKAGPVSLTDATTEGAVTRIKFKYGGGEYYADFTYSNGSFTRTGGSNGYTFSGNWTMKEENGVLTMTADYNEMSSQWIYFVCTFYANTNEYTAKSTGSWNYSFSGIEVNGTDITDQLRKVK